MTSEQVPEKNDPVVRVAFGSGMAQERVTDLHLEHVHRVRLGSWSSIQSCSSAWDDVMTS